MTRIDRICGIAERHGLSLVEFFAVEVVAVFATDPRTAARFIEKILEGSPFADADGSAALQRCIDNGWVGLSPHGTLAATPQGAAMMHRISAELAQPA